MRRALVLTDESARHPFRRGLPAHVRETKAPAATFAWRLTAGDVRGVASVYFTTFAAALAFIV